MVGAASASGFEGGCIGRASLFGALFATHGLATATKQVIETQHVLGREHDTVPVDQQTGIWSFGISADQ